MKHLLILLPALLLWIQSHAVTVQIYAQSYPACVYPTGSLIAIASGGVGPYSYLWSTGSTETQIDGIPEGTYSITVTDLLGEVGYAEITLFVLPLDGGNPFWLPGCHTPLNPGSSQGLQLFTSGHLTSVGMPPHTISTGAGALISTPFANDYFSFGPNWFEPAGSPLQISVTDANGCSFEVNTTVPQPRQPLTAQVLQVDGACSGGSNGRFRVFVPAEASAWATGLEVHGSNGTWNWSTGVSQVPVGYADRDLTTGPLPPGTYHVISKIAWDWYYMAEVQEEHYFMLEEVCPDTIAVVVVPDLGFTCGTLSGRLFVDNNLNCTQNGGEPGLPATVVEVQPGNYYALTNTTGNFSLNLPYGTYTVADQNPLFQEHCGASTTPFTLSAGTPNVTRNLPDTSLVGLDVRVTMGSSPARPGFELSYGLGVQNLTGATSGAGTLTFTFDPILTFLASVPPPTNVSGNTLTWSFASMNAFQNGSYSPRFQVPPDIALLGTELVAAALVSTVNTDTDLSNNSATYMVTVTGAYDPNDKLARTSSGNTSQWQINEDEWIDYTIRFQNTGSDTAFFVVITDTLPDNLDPATFQAGVASHTHNITLQGQGIVRWIFPNILLPDSNANEPLSHGFVTFRIHPRLPLLPGDAIENIANIYFDFNPPVITEPSVLVATTGTGVVDVAEDELMLWPNPTDGTLFIRSGSIQLLSGRIRIRASNGRVVLEQGINGNLISLDVGQLAPGIYAVECIDQQGQRSTARFVRQ